MHETLQGAAGNVNPQVQESMQEALDFTWTLQQHLAFTTLRVEQNFRAIGYARLHKEVSRLKLDEEIAPLLVEDGAAWGAPNHEEADDAVDADKWKGGSAKPHVVVSLERLLSHVLPMKITQRP